MNVSRTATAGPVNLLWTGGWDSTFRLLQLLLQHRFEVAPIYLQDGTRASTQTELETMARIGRRLREEHPHTRGLLQPVRIADAAEAEEDADIESALREVRKRVYIGSQYGWLASFCKRNGILDVELCVHVDDKVQALLRDFVAETRHPAGYPTLRLDPRHEGGAEFELFRYFSFPVFRIDKLGMARQAEDAGWSAYMDMTWFCHSPVGGKPCGVCGPCVYTIEEGLARRIPPSRRALSFFYRHLALPLKGPLRQMRASLRG
ncbi:hypothetical protein FCE95_08715 [Luteimonas gilva]|uniref:7-cyano-7-deazaguanine synthase n=1 Tax=Luteimonas gilva TaxID=2572684 RepID=A0A4V5ZPS5_9GAMM|nr:hypothetical protein [Luteimonas gilva]TKR30213.1 hypothetical protein FCE95_08715 [Luteimonas gilva]